MQNKNAKIKCFISYKIFETIYRGLLGQCEPRPKKLHIQLL